MDNVNLEKLLNAGSRTTSLFWDCECEENYIHPKDDALCPRCNTYRDDQPDSMVSEVARMDPPEAIKIRLLAELECEGKKIQTAGCMIAPPDGYAKYATALINIGGDNHILMEEADVAIGKKGDVWLKTPWLADQIQMLASKTA